MGSNPLAADSDEDGFYDLEEVNWRTDLCGPETPPYHRQPRLHVSGLGALSFNVATNLTNSPKRTLRLFNGGGDELQWMVNASEPWIEINPPGGTGPGSVDIGVTMQGMALGLYTAAHPLDAACILDLHTERQDTENPAHNVTQFSRTAHIIIPPIIHAIVCCVPYRSIYACDEIFQFDIEVQDLRAMDRFY